MNNAMTEVQRVEMRRRNDERIDSVQDDITELKIGHGKISQSMSTLQKSLSEHNDQTRVRIAEVHTRLNDIDKSMAAQEQRDMMQTTILQKLDTRTESIVNEYNAIKKFPAILKWIAGTIAGLVAIGVYLLKAGFITGA